MTALIAIGFGIASLLNLSWYMVVLPQMSLVIYSRWRGINATLFDAVILILSLGILILGLMVFLN